MFHITFTLHVYNLTVISGDGVKGEEVARPVTAVQDCVFKPQDNSNCGDRKR